MVTRLSSEEVYDHAANWAARIDAGPLGSDEQARLESWLAAEFARYSDVRIRIDDPAIAREKVTGLFVSTDPVGFARAVCVSIDLRSEIGDKQIRLMRPSS